MSISSVVQPTAPTVVLAQDDAWPKVPGVCCWRHGVHEAFASAGAAVTEVHVRGQFMNTPTHQGSAPRAPWLGPARPLLAWLYRRSRLAIRWTLGRPTALVAAARARAQHQRLRPLAGEAIPIVAEGLGVAEALIAAGIPPRRIWPLVLPAERLYPNAPSIHADRVARLAPLVAGFLTDSEASRESIERASSAYRLHVEIFPPATVDRPCPTCANGNTVGPDENQDVAKIVSWAKAVDQHRTGSEHPGIPAPSAPGRQLDWNQGGYVVLDTVRNDVNPACAIAYRQDRAAAAILNRAPCPLPATNSRPRNRIVISGFDLKFVRELAGSLDRRCDLEITLDAWPALARPSAQTARLVHQANTVVAEWARPSAAWISRRKKHGQLLIVRLHRYELDYPYPREIDIEQVDAVVYVSPPIGRRIRDELGWPAEKLVYIPNYLDVEWFDRPKLPGARFGIGLVGIGFANKRFDLALDVLAKVRRDDPRFSMFVRSPMPWDNAYSWAKAGEREFLHMCIDRIENDPLLRGGVHFDPPGQDMARWYRKVGQVLSMSDIESFHLAAAEGMASGAVPVIRPWPGASEIYDKQWIHDSADDAAAVILANADRDLWHHHAVRAKAEIRQAVDPALVVQAWADLTSGAIESARSRLRARDT